MGPGALLYSSSLRLVTNPALRTLIWREQIDFRMSFPHSRFYPPVCASCSYRHCHGAPCGCVDLFSLGKTVGSASESVNDPHFFRLAKIEP
jgi:hypothetical protein